MSAPRPGVNEKEAKHIEELLYKLVYTPLLLTEEEKAEIDQITKEYGGEK